MPVTSIQMEDKHGVVRRLQFITEQHPTGLYVGVYACNEEWVPQGPPSQTTDERPEEVYHKQLRAQADSNGHLVREYTTDPDWNPEYKPESDNQDAL